MRVSQRQVVLALLAILAVGSVLALIYQLVVPDPSQGPAITLLGVILLNTLLFLYWRGWEPARYVALVLMTLLVGFGTDGVYLRETFTLTAFMPPVLALIVAGPLAIIGSTLGLLAILILRAGGQGVYVDPLSMLLYIMPVGGILLARLVTDTARHDAEQSAAQASQALAQSQTQAQLLSQKAQELADQNQQQQQLLSLVSTLETPAVALANGVLLAPIVGHVDSRRIAAMTRRLLAEVGAQRARMVILDIAGVPGIDTAVAQALLHLIQALRLLGCEVTVTGIPAAVAATMTQLGINMAGVRTARTPQEVLQQDLQLR